MRFILILVSFLTFHALVAQETPQRKKDRFPSYFGVAVSPIVPNNFIGSKTSVFDSAGITTTFNQRTGIQFGASVRIGVTKLISIETGIYQVRRNFTADIAVPDSNVFGSKTLGFVNYDIPINALVYVQLADQWYMNASLGFSVNQYPSDVMDTLWLGTRKLQFEGRRVHRTHFSTNAGIGFELRTKKAGTFYLGGSGKIPFQPILFGVGVMTQLGTSSKFRSFGRVSGGYFSLDFRYYIPTTRLKGTQFKPGPIEQ